MKILRGIYYFPLIVVIVLIGEMADLCAWDALQDVCARELFLVSCRVRGGGPKS